ncbi:Transmembrane GTPase Marf [Lucilia cuprina]|nr:Transmembrane GTPase Marf [Lucilia cuprina]
MAAYLNRTLSVVTGNGGNAALNAEADIVDKAERELSWYTRVLARDHMKVAFFVRTSNGKSSVINAMLREKILPSGIGHTTNCFCQKKLSESSLVRIFWPRERCSLLRDDVVFVDSPGVDVSANLDDWIDNHCLNADVFVLYPQKLSKPNIFILNNRWDASAHEPESQESARIEEAKGNSPSQGALAEGFQMRYFEFQDFERKFEECISKSAVQTKFEKHSSRGKTLSGDMRSMLDNIFERITIFRNLKVDQKTLLTERIQGTETEMMNVTREMKLKIHNMVEEVEQKVSKALNEEIWRLPLVLNIYKKELNGHVEAGLGSNLRPDYQWLCDECRGSTKGNDGKILYHQLSPVVGNITQEQLSIISRFALTQLDLKAQWVVLIVAGIMLKTIGWRVVSGVFGALYAPIVDQFGKVKEAFKASMLRHATQKKLINVVDLHQPIVVNRSCNTFARTVFVPLIRQPPNEMKKGQLAILEANSKQLKLLRTKANYIQNELEILKNHYIARIILIELMFYLPNPIKIKNNYKQTLH